MPLAGLIVGVATFGRLIVYVAVTMSLSVVPVLEALALIVVVELIGIGL